MLSLAKKSWTQCHANLTEGEVNRGFIKPPEIRFGIKYFNNFTQRKTLLRGIFDSTGSDVHFPSKILREFFIEIRIYYLGEFRKLYAKVCFWKLNISEEKVFIIYLQVWDLQEFWNSVNARERGIYVRFHLKENTLLNLRRNFNSTGSDIHFHLKGLRKNFQRTKMCFGG